MTRDLVNVESVCVTFDGVRAVQDLTISIPQGGRVAVIGPNGAGKSTLVRCISGDLRPTSGDIRFDGQDLRGVSAPARARRGIGRTFQNLELFGSLSVIDNVLTALDSETSLLGSFRNVGHRSSRRARAAEALKLFEIDRYADVAAGSLPYGVRKLVELSRALVTSPRLLLLDEPVAGLADTEEFVHTLADAIDRRECTVLLVEHDMPTVQTICNMVHVMDAGQMIASGTYADVSSDPRVVEAYLGVQSQGNAPSSNSAGELA